MDWKEVDKATICSSSLSFFSSTVSYLSWKTDPEFHTNTYFYTETKCYEKIYIYKKVALSNT